ncbi:hypothetical protein EV200_101812 [Pedobacter psychrotolerans]|uniref:Uncharacterized protein n=1 Tax=Pedobacter psychrotolerans TaxID=1843235 RepID=A0A4R2HMG4_9SPHI|nr:hypothetical protein EV200_101812 [Pedobacter psychrotolerans]
MIYDTSFLHFEKKLLLIQGKEFPKSIIFNIHQID